MFGGGGLGPCWVGGVELEENGEVHLLVIFVVFGCWQKGLKLLLYGVVWSFLF